MCVQVRQPRFEQTRGDDRTPKTILAPTIGAFQYRLSNIGQKSRFLRDVLGEDGLFEKLGKNFRKKVKIFDKFLAFAVVT